MYAAPRPPFSLRCMTCTRSGSARAASSASSPVPSGLPSSTINTCTSGCALCNRPRISGRFSRSLYVGMITRVRALGRSVTGSTPVRSP
ncbi:Uncharacterised protein [Mycobacteroides abscessus subsp. abscessus]|nr:Uncharacterised protein [Mycobacteroides abscessus subsp. abscessus]